MNTLYSYIEKRVFLTLSNQHLWEKWKKRPKAKGQERRIAHPKLPSIEARPDHIAQRLEYGHWEMDLVVSCKGGKSVLLTLTEHVFILRIRVQPVWVARWFISVEVCWILRLQM